MPPRARTEEKRRELLGPIADLFDREGYTTTSVETIAREVGLSKGALYHYFASKEEILVALHEEFIDVLIERAETRAEERASERVRAAMRDVLELMRTHRGHVRVFFEHHRELPQVPRTEILRKRDRYAELVGEAARAAVAEGEWRPDVDPRLATLAIFGMCNWAYQWYRPDGALDTDAVAEAFWQMLFDGVRRQT